MPPLLTAWELDPYGDCEDIDETGSETKLQSTSNSGIMQHSYNKREKKQSRDNLQETDTARWND